MYVNEFIEQIKLGKTVRMNNVGLYGGLKVNDGTTVVYMIEENALHPEYVGFINNSRNCYYVDYKHVHDEAFKFDDFKDGWSFNVRGCEYMDNVVCGKECKLFKSDLMLKRTVLQRYYKSIGEEIKKLIRDVDMNHVETDYKGVRWFYSLPTYIMMTEQEHIMQSIKNVDKGVNWHNLAFGLSDNDDYIKECAKEKIEQLTDSQLDEYKDSYTRACADYDVFHDLLTKPYKNDNLYYWLCLDIERAIDDVDSAIIKMTDGKTYTLRNMIYDVSETSYIGGDCGKKYQIFPFVNIVAVEVDGVRVYDRDKSIRRLESAEFLEALNDMASQDGTKRERIQFSDLVFSNGQFGIVLTDDKVFYEDKKLRKLDIDECVLCNTSLAGLGVMKESVINLYEKCGLNKDDLNKLKGTFEGDKSYGYER